MSCKVDGRDDIGGTTEVYSLEGWQWKNGGNVIYMEGRVCLFLVERIEHA